MDGVLIVNKPAGLTSHDVVWRARRITGERRIGHTGTLDPFATGVLVLLVGRATRLAQFLAGAVKEYEALIRFGYATDTGDLTGTPRQNPKTMKSNGDGEARHEKLICSWSDAQLEAALGSLRGPLEQVPPMYSAKKIRGRKLYELARRGIEVERLPVSVHVYAFEKLTQADGVTLRHNDDGTCDLATRVVCSAGTYVRALAETLGERLGTEAHLAALRRTRAGNFGLEASVSLDELQRMADGGAMSSALLPLNAALSELPFINLNVGDARRARHGAAIYVSRSSDATMSEAITAWPDACSVRMLDAANQLIAVGVYDAKEKLLRPRVMLAPDSAETS